MTLRNDEYKSDVEGIWISKTALEYWHDHYFDEKAQCIDQSLKVYFTGKLDIIRKLLYLNQTC